MQLGRKLEQATRFPPSEHLLPTRTEAVSPRIQIPVQPGAESLGKGFRGKPPLGRSPNNSEKISLPQMQTIKGFAESQKYSLKAKLFCFHPRECSHRQQIVRIFIRVEFAWLSSPILAAP